MADHPTFMMQQTLQYIWSKHGPKKQLAPHHLVGQEIESLRRAVHVHTFVASKEWDKYLLRHYSAMVEDQASFYRYTAFACYLEIETYKNDFDRFIRLIALVAYFALFCFAKGARTAYLHAEPLLEKFFHLEMSHLEADVTFLKELNYFIMRKGYLGLNLAVEKMLHESLSKKVIVEMLLESSVFTNPDTPADQPPKKPIASMHNGAHLSNIDTKTIEGHNLTKKLVCALDKTVHRELREEKFYVPKMLPFSTKLKTIIAVGKELRHVSLQTSVFTLYLDMAKENLEYKYTMKRRLLEAPFMRDMDVQSVSDVLRSIQNPVKADD